VKIGVWEGGKFIGAIVFGDGLLGPKSVVYGSVDKFKVAEIVRIALQGHQHPVSKMISIAIMERHGRIHTALSWMDSRPNAIFAVGTFSSKRNSPIGKMASDINRSVFIQSSTYFPLDSFGSPALYGPILFR